MSEIRLTGVEEFELGRRAARSLAAPREALRARVVLLAADGADDAEIARRLRCSARTALRWRRRFAQERLAGLEERKGAPRTQPVRPRRREHAVAVAA
jgi:transposase